MRQNDTDHQSRRLNNNSLLANTIARTSGERLEDSFPVVVEYRLVLFQPARRNERGGFGEIVGRVICGHLRDGDKGLQAN